MPKVRSERKKVRNAECQKCEVKKMKNRFNNYQSAKHFEFLAFRLPHFGNFALLSLRISHSK